MTSKLSPRGERILKTLKELLGLIQEPIFNGYRADMTQMDLDSEDTKLLISNHTNLPNEQFELLQKFMMKVKIVPEKDAKPFNLLKRTLTPIIQTLENGDESILTFNPESSKWIMEIVVQVLKFRAVIQPFDHDSLLTYQSPSVGTSLDLAQLYTILPASLEELVACIINDLKYHGKDSTRYNIILRLQLLFSTLNSVVGWKQKLQSTIGKSCSITDTTESSTDTTYSQNEAISPFRFQSARYEFTHRFSTTSSLQKPAPLDEQFLASVRIIGKDAFSKIDFAQAHRQSGGTIKSTADDYTIAQAFQEAFTRYCVVINGEDGAPVTKLTKDGRQGKHHLIYRLKNPALLLGAVEETVSEGDIPRFDELKNNIFPKITPASFNYAKYASFPGNLRPFHKPLSNFGLVPTRSKPEELVTSFMKLQEEYFPETFDRNKKDVQKHEAEITEWLTQFPRIEDFSVTHSLQMAKFVSPAGASTLAARYKLIEEARVSRLTLKVVIKEALTAVQKSIKILEKVVETSKRPSDLDIDLVRAHQVTLVTTWNALALNLSHVQRRIATLKDEETLLLKRESLRKAALSLLPPTVEESSKEWLQRRAIDSKVILKPINSDRKTESEIKTLEADGLIRVATAADVQKGSADFYRNLTNPISGTANVRNLTIATIFAQILDVKLRILPPAHHYELVRKYYDHAVSFLVAIKSEKDFDKSDYKILVYLGVSTAGKKAQILPRIAARLEQLQAAQQENLRDLKSHEKELKASAPEVKKKALISKKRSNESVEDSEEDEIIVIEKKFREEDVAQRKRRRT